MCYICYLNDKYGECIVINCCVGLISYMFGCGIIYLYSMKILLFIGNCVLVVKLLMYGINCVFVMWYIYVFIIEF